MTSSQDLLQEVPINQGKSTIQTHNMGLWVLIDVCVISGCARPPAVIGFGASGSPLGSFAAPPRCGLTAIAPPRTSRPNATGPSLPTGPTGAVARRLRLDTMPSRPILQAWANTVGPSGSICSLEP
jgi:hypothetical protein